MYGGEETNICDTTLDKKTQQDEAFKPEEIVG